MGPAAAAEFLRLLAERALRLPGPGARRDSTCSPTPRCPTEQRHSRHGEDSHGAPEENPHPRGVGSRFFSPSPATRPIDRFRDERPSSTSSTRRWGCRKDEPREGAQLLATWDHGQRTLPALRGEEELPLRPVTGSAAEAQESIELVKSNRKAEGGDPLKRC